MVPGTANKDSSAQHTGLFSNFLSRFYEIIVTVLVHFNLNHKQGLLSAPNPDDPLDNNAAEHWKRNEADAVSKGKQ